jgi:hypothetical protein
MGKHSHFLILIALTIATLACSLSGVTGGPAPCLPCPDCIHTVQGLGAVHLTETNEIPDAYRAASEAVIASLIDDDEDPEEFWVTFDQPDESHLVFHLWHKSAFSECHCCETGNPGGECRDFTVHLPTLTIVDKSFWQ